MIGAVAGCQSLPATTGTGVEADAGVDVDVSDPVICATRGGARGLSRREITIDGLRRTFWVYLPPEAPATQPLPLVVAFHGYTMSGKSMYDITQYQALADRETIALAFPDGQGGPNSVLSPWNVGAGVCPTNFGLPPVATGDDFALLDFIKADVALDQCVDRDHVFVTGFSMGGYFTNHAGCMRSDIRAIAPHSGGAHELAGCLVSRKPVILFHGSLDPLVPPGCSDPNARPIPNVTPAADAWAEHNGCSTTTTSRMEGDATCIHYEACPADGQVELCTFEGMGHCWAGGAASGGIYACPNRGSATELEWRFFKQYAW